MYRSYSEIGTFDFKTPDWNFGHRLNFGEFYFYFFVFFIYFYFLKHFSLHFPTEVQGSAVIV